MEIPFGSTLRSMGESMETRIHPAIIHTITLLIPVNIYVIGDWLGAGVQWPLFRYQETIYGASIISIFTDAGYILNGTLTGRTAFSIALWILGAIFLVAALLVALFRKGGSSAKLRGVALVAGSLLFLLSSMVQYGFLFHGQAGFVIPIGIPVLLILGFIVSGEETQFSEMTLGSHDEQDRE
jgi:hypothetical protein